MQIIYLQICLSYLFLAFAVGGGAIAHKRTFEDSRIESADGVSLAKGERRTSKIAAGNGNASARFAANVI